MTWQEFIELQNLNLLVPRAADPRMYPYSRQSPMRRAARRQGTPSPGSHAQSIRQAVSLVTLLLHPESHHRYTPREALAHPFLAVEGEDDDDFFPHPYGGGVCGEWHEMSDDGTQWAKVRDETEWGVKVVEVAAGQGQAIGRAPCELHTDFAPR
jgi:cell division control protein 7